MSATNGKRRSRGRLFSLSLVAVFALSAIFAASASAVFKPVQTTMALGDSLAFGYSQQDFNQHLGSVEPASAFEKGYANFFLEFQKFRLNKIQLDNLGCPGETTDSLIGDGPLAAGLGIPAEEQEAPCAYHEVAAEKAGFPKGTKFPLHHEYGENGFHEPQSQLESALEQLVVNGFGGTPVTTVTLNIGANDELHEIAKCEAEVKSEIKPEEGKFFSKYGGEKAGLEGAAEGGEAQKDGKEAEAKGADAFAKGADAKSKGAAAKAEGEEAATDGAEAKSAFEKGENELGAELKAEAEEDQKAAEAEGAAAAKEGGEAEAEGKEAEALGVEAHEDGKAAEALFLESGEQGVSGCVEAHVEELFGHILKNIGRTLFVLRNAEKFTGIPGTNYTGQIIFQGGYDPFGRVYKTEAEVTAAKAVGPQFARAKLGELDRGTVGLAAVLNGHENELVTFGPPENPGEFHGCFAKVEGGAEGHPGTAFNPGLGLESGVAGRLQKFTNMNNQTSTEFPPTSGKFLANGPDIHPTEAGAKDLGLIMWDECK
jgi:hypothetical protein